MIFGQEPVSKASDPWHRWQVPSGIFGRELKPSHVQAEELHDALKTDAMANGAVGAEPRWPACLWRAVMSVAYTGFPCIVPTSLLSLLPRPRGMGLVVDWGS